MKAPFPWFGVAKKVHFGYNTGVNYIKSDGALERRRHLFSIRDRGTNTMFEHTLPLFSLQPETKEIPLTQGQVAIVDAADYEWLTQWKWYAHKRGGAHIRTYYARRSVTMPDGKQGKIAMHQLICGKGTDHIDGNGLNNTRANLRTASPQQNSRNCRPFYGSTSRFKGVTWHKRKGKWQAQIHIGNKSKYLGIFGDETEAARAYDVAAKKLYGEFAWLNFKETR